MKQADKIEHLPVEDLIPYARNARTHSDAQVEQIANSIRTFGFNNPVLVDETNGIVAGHGRVLAARLIGLESVPCIRLGWLSDAEKRAYILADNRIAENSGWDQAMLDAELEDLDLAGIDRELMGFLEILEDDKPDQVKDDVQTREVNDVFWINVVGPLKNQARVLDRLRAALADIEPVTIELGTVSRD